MLDDQGFYLSVSFFCWEFGFFCCLFIFNQLNFVYSLEKKSSHQGRGKQFCVWVFFALWIFFLCVFLLCSWVQTRIERIYSKMQDFLFVLAGMLSFCRCSLCSVCFGNYCTVHYEEEEQGCASSTQLTNEAFADVHMGRCRSRAYGFGKRLMCAS